MFVRRFRLVTVKHRVGLPAAGYGIAVPAKLAAMVPAVVETAKVVLAAVVLFVITIRISSAAITPVAVFLIVKPAGQAVVNLSAIPIYVKPAMAVEAV
ncbi:MAG TPA: hypothetical protein DDW84_04710 [Phycisphaerales bacterium]|nr:hypothetical protein [Phycisphaerales bacterium]HBR19066.1 hypothetical protein [Phycisphaerales bacterium]